MLPDGLQYAPFKAVLVRRARERLVDRVRVLRCLFVHAPAAINVVDRTSPPGLSIGRPFSMSALAPSKVWSPSTK